eukprot:3699495-Pyramimonas_sp.AAC.1
MGKLAIWGNDALPCPEGVADAITTAWKSDRPPEERGMKVLGAPFGTAEYIDAFWAKLSTERAQLLNILPKLPSRQAAWLI